MILLNYVPVRSEVNCFDTVKLRSSPLPSSPSRMQDINVYKIEVALSAFNLGDYCMLSVLILILILILLFINYMYYTVCVVASSTVFSNFSVNLNTTRKRMNNFPEVAITAFLSTSYISALVF